jgi:AraC-like DNA-binding protein
MYNIACPYICLETDMAQKMVGYTWETADNVSPSLISAFETYGKHVLSSHSSIYKTWVLDYAFERHGLYKAGFSSMKWRVRRKNTAHLYPPNTGYWEDTRKQKGQRHSAWVIFTKGADADLGRLISPEYRYARFKDPEGALGKNIVKAAQAGFKQREYGFWEAQSYMCSSISLLLHAEFDKNETFVIRDAETSVYESDLVREADLFLKSRLTEKITLAQIARHCHVSASALSHRYKKETGLSPLRRLHQMRIDHAKALIMRGYPLKGIAYDLGYSDEFHLSKIFKRITGVSPREFKKTGLVNS